MRVRTTHRQYAAMSSHRTKAGSRRTERVPELAWMFRMARHRSVLREIEVGNGRPVNRPFAIKERCSDGAQGARSH